LASAAVAAVQRNQVRKAQAVNGGKDGTAAQNTAATANRGGGGGGTGNDSTIASSGGSGVVVIRQAANAKFPTTLTNATTSLISNYIVFSFNTSGSIGWS
jgi:hypothetical protein